MGVRARLRGFCHARTGRIIEKHKHPWPAIKPIKRARKKVSKRDVRAMRPYSRPITHSADSQSPPTIGQLTQWS